MNTFILNRIVFILAAAGVTTLAVADDMSPTNQSLPTLTSQQFVSDAAVGGMKEILLSEAALETSTNDDIKDFAKHMVRITAQRTRS
jgi:predicted outer membrane protein